MAKALYDNVPESPEELAFRKGDILTVMEQNTGGLEGWWLCSLHGRQGIAPGNRLKLLVGPAFEAQPAAAPPHSYQQKAGSGARGLYQVPQQQSIYQVPPGQDVYQVPPQRTAADHTPSKVVTPSRVGQSYSYVPGQQGQQDLYDIPPSRSQGVYDIPPGQLYPVKLSEPRSLGVYDVPPPQTDLVYDVPPSPQGVYSVPPCRTTSAQQEATYDFPQPLKHKQEGIYDVPPPLLSAHGPHYDFPPCPAESRHKRPGSNGNEGVYDMPPPPAPPPPTPPQQDVYDFPRGHGNIGIYDVPAQDAVNRLSFSSTGSTRSSMSTSSSSTGSDGRLVLDVDAAAQRLRRLQQAVEHAVGALHSTAASPHWGTFPSVDRHGNDIRAALDRVRAALGDFVAFGRGAAANATALSDGGLHNKLRRQLGRLEDSQQILLQIHQNLENRVPNAPGKNHNKTEDLDRFVMVSRTVPDDAKQVASTIGSNGELLFRRTPVDGTPEDTLNPASPSSEDEKTKPFPVPSRHDKDNMNHGEKCVKSWMEDYDYVHLQGKEDFERQQRELLEKENIMKQSPVQLGPVQLGPVQLGPEQINQFKKLEQEVIKPVDNDVTRWISASPGSVHVSSASPGSVHVSSASPGSAHVSSRDRQLLGFYSEQCEQHFATLLSAADAFFGCVGAGQPPRIFVAHSKFVILSAHKLVFIGDTLSRQASVPEVSNRVTNSSNVLCDLLKTVVAATKAAALNYPNTAAIQEMVDRVTELSLHAQRFKEQLLQMARV